jgi:hypothetical protein
MPDPEPTSQQAPETASERPELLVGAAFLGGMVLAQLLKRLGPAD